MAPHSNGGSMPTYLWQVSYTSDGVKALTKDGAVKRRTFVQQMLAKAGGKLHAFYYALGEADAYVIAELPDTASAVALSELTMRSSLAALCFCSPVRKAALYPGTVSTMC